MAELYFPTEAQSVLVNQLQLIETGSIKIQILWIVLQANGS